MFYQSLDKRKVKWTKGMQTQLIEEIQMDNKHMPYA